MKAFLHLLFGACALALAGCALQPLSGGRASTSGAIGQVLVQSDNPAQSSRQTQATIRTRTYTVPTGSVVESTVVGRSGAGRLFTNIESVIVNAPMPVVEREETRASSELGAAQKDTAREIGAKLASLKGVVWVGVLMFVFGLATLFYPPLRAIVGSVTTSAAIVAGGLALTILPTLIVGNELLILAVVLMAVGGWFIAHRYGKMRGLVEANQNGPEDRGELKTGA